MMPVKNAYVFLQFHLYAYHCVFYRLSFEQEKQQIFMSKFQIIIISKDDENSSVLYIKRFVLTPFFDFR